MERLVTSPSDAVPVDLISTTRWDGSTVDVGSEGFNNVAKVLKKESVRL